MENYYLILLIIFIALCTVLICWKAIYIYKISKHPYPKFTSGFSLLLFALIAFIFGIHADIFSSYDKSSNKLNQSYNWFDPADIIKFPIDQYRINKKEFPPNVINIDTALNKPYDRKYTIVIDKTKSTDATAFTQKISSEMKKSLNLELQQSVSQNGLYLDNLMVEDLFVLTAMKQLSQNIESKNIIEVIYYLGDGKMKSPYDIDLSITDENLCEKMQQYIKYYNDTILNSTKGKFTNLNEIINKLRDKAYLGDNNTIYTNLYFISDFEHEEESGASFTEFNVNLHSLNEVKINQINLIKIKGKNNNTENVNTTLKLFRENFSHLYFYEFNEDLMYYDKKPVDAISSIFSSTTFDESQQAIYLYYLWNDANIHYDFIGNLTLNSNNSIKTIVLGLRDKIQTTNYNDYSGYLLLNDSKDKVFSFSSNQIPFENGKESGLTFTTEKTDNKNYYLELAIPGHTFKASEPIVLRQVLPETSCVYLIYLYALFFTNITSLVLYFIVCLWHSHEPLYRLKKTLVISFFICFIILALPICWSIFSNYFSLIKEGFNFQNSFFFTVTILSALTLHSFYFTFSYKKKKSQLIKIIDEK